MFLYDPGEMARCRIPWQVGQMLEFLAETPAPDPDGWYYNWLMMELDSARIVLSHGWYVDKFSDSVYTVLHQPNLPAEVASKSLQAIAESIEKAEEYKQSAAVLFALHHIPHPSVRPMALMALATTSFRSNAMLNILISHSADILDLLKHPSSSRATEVKCGLFALKVLINLSPGSSVVTEPRDAVKRLGKVLRSKLESRAALNLVFLLLAQAPSSCRHMVETGALASALCNSDLIHGTSPLIDLCLKIAETLPDELFPKLVTTPRFMTTFSTVLIHGSITVSLQNMIAKIIQVGDEIARLKRHLCSSEPFDEQDGLSNCYVDYWYAVKVPILERRPFLRPGAPAFLSLFRDVGMK